MDHFSGWCNSKRRLEDVTAVVTGANTGIGKETVRDFYKRGARVIMACRNMSKAAAAKHEIEESKGPGTLVIEHIDLCSLNSVREFADRLLAREDRINILVNNAGVMCCPESKTEDGFEMHMGSNHLAHALLTLLLLPKMISSGPSRIIFVSSAIHYFHKIDFEDFDFFEETTSYEPLEAYSKSKIAQIMFAKALAMKLKKDNIKHVTTYSLHPGIVYTDIDRHYKDTAWFWVTYFFRSPLLNWMWKSPRCGAQTTVYCAVDEACANESGLYYSDCAPNPPSSYCERESDVMRLWNITVEKLNWQD